ncbi:hypothetical protein Scep_020555 [Stephania cephalantha]|uniref:Uncharacterized protein n=1 Tax=Stephania cephalantha TaxID=152367 RepID=A0AAP0NQX4_9MAGN
MAGFSLGGGNNNNNNQYPPSEESALFVYRSNEENSISGYPNNKGFEIWHHHHHHFQHQAFASEEQGIMYTSSSTGLPCRRRGSSSSSDHEFLGMNNMLMTMRSSSQGGGGVSCQDCGNQAKKDCLHMRCRTCCKNRNLPCQTHVKSTWVPASRRRERLQQQQQQQQQEEHDKPKQQHNEQMALADNTKRPREILADHSPGTIYTPTIQNNNNRSGGFPGQVSTPAVFRCVRVSSAIDDSEDQYAYQAAVNIGGHVFKGILYDQGLETHYEASSAGGAGEVHTTTRCLMTSNAETATTTAMNVSTGGAGGALIDPTSLYPTPLNAFVAGTQFFGHPRS